MGSLALHPSLKLAASAAWIFKSSTPSPPHFQTGDSLVLELSPEIVAVLQTWVSRNKEVNMVFGLASPLTDCMGSPVLCFQYSGLQWHCTGMGPLGSYPKSPFFVSCPLKSVMHYSVSSFHPEFECCVCIRECNLLLDCFRGVWYLQTLF